jgi:hypothetical protein
METKAKLETALKEAMKAGDDVRKRTVRMALAAIRQQEIDRQVQLDETGVLTILQKEIKTRKEAMEEARKAERPDLIAAAEAEIAVVETFLPKAMNAEELATLVEAAITEVGAASPTDMGKVMKALMPKVAGRAPGDQVSTAVRQRLQK